VYQAGTLSGNPLAMTAGIETLKLIDENPNFYRNLETIGASLENGVRDALGEFGANYTLNRCGSMFTLFFTDQAVTDFDSAKTSETSKFSAYFNSMLENGIYLPPSQFEACFVSSVHTDEDLQRTVKAVSEALGKIN